MHIWVSVETGSSCERRGGSVCGRVVQAWYKRGTSVVRAWYERGTSVVHCLRGTGQSPGAAVSGGQCCVYGWYTGGTRVARGWHEAYCLLVPVRVREQL